MAGMREGATFLVRWECVSKVMRSGRGERASWEKSYLLKKCACDNKGNNTGLDSFDDQCSMEVWLGLPSAERCLKLMAHNILAADISIYICIHMS